MPEEGNLIASALGVIVTGVISGVASGVCLQVAVDARRYREEQLGKIVEILDHTILKVSGGVLAETFSHPPIPFVRNVGGYPADSRAITRDLRHYVRALRKSGVLRLSLKSKETQRRLQALCEWCDIAEADFQKGKGTPVEALIKVRALFD